MATAERPDDTAVQDPVTDEERTARRAAREDAARTPGPATPSALEVARARQRDEFGGINWGASFFGWLVDDRRGDAADRAARRRRRRRSA